MQAIVSTGAANVRHGIAQPPGFTLFSHSYASPRLSLSLPDVWHGVCLFVRVYMLGEKSTAGNAHLKLYIVSSSEFTIYFIVLYLVIQKRRDQKSLRREICSPWLLGWYVTKIFTIEIPLTSIGYFSI